MMKSFPIIDLAATGSNIRQLRIERGLSVRDLQSYFGFEEPQAIYKWQRGESLPTVDNLYALGAQSLKHASMLDKSALNRYDSQSNLNLDSQSNLNLRHL